MIGQRNRQRNPREGALAKGIRSRAGRGFTLIELLVVIAIIALLISILLPSLQRARAQGKLIKCLAHMRGCGQAMVVFAREHDDRFQLATDEVGIQAADPSRRRFAYDWNDQGNGELLAWPVALAQSSGADYKHNWDWGIRADSYASAVNQLAARKDLQKYELVTCPADQGQVATPHYPRDKGSGNNGLLGNGPTGANMAYWSYLSFGINEDIAGAEVAESNGNPACGRAASTSGGNWMWCTGETGYPSTHPCGRSGMGSRLQGNLERVFDPASTGLIFDAGSDTDPMPGDDPEDYANLIISAQTHGPYLGDFQQYFPKRLPTRRHYGSRINVLFTDTHGETAKPIKWDDRYDFGKLLPSRYSPKVRVSPYQPHKTN